MIEFYDVENKGSAISSKLNTNEVVFANDSVYQISQNSDGGILSKTC